MSPPAEVEPTAASKPWRFPRGAGALPPALVAEIQRARLCEALAAVCAERGYTKATTAAVAEAASISRRTFYALFESKEECFLAAYRLYSEQLGEELKRAGTMHESWPERVRAAIAAALAFAAELPAAAQLLIVEVRNAGPEAVAMQRGSLAALATGLREGRERHPPAAGLPPGTEEQIVAAIASCLHSRLLTGEAERLGGLEGELAEFALAPYLGWGGDAPLTDHPQPISATPRDRAAVSPALVDETQRARVFDSLLAMPPERGYGAITIDHILLDAGMSARTFYRLFDGKQDCLIAAYRHYAAQLASALEAAWQGESAWPERVRAAIAAALRFAAENPDVVRLLAVGVQAAGPEARAARDESLDRLAAKLRQGRERYPAAATFNPATEDAIVAGFLTVVGNRLLAGEADSLPGLEADLADFALSPYLGPEASHRLAVS